MRQASKRIPDSAEKTVRDIRRNTRRHHSAEEKIRIVLEGLRGEVSIAELCRKEGIAQNLYYRWSKEFLEAGKKRLAGDNPWGGATLEWQISSPPPTENFETIPVVKGGPHEFRELERHG